MSDEIKVGDMVWVVRGHKCVVDAYGLVPCTVVSITKQFAYGFHCILCGEQNIARGAIAARLSWHRNENSAVPLSWLKKINPPAQSDETETSRELVAHV